MAVAQLGTASVAVARRVRRTVALLRRRGYALTPAQLAATCLGGPVSESDVLRTVVTDPDLALAHGLVLERTQLGVAAAIRRRALGHAAEAAPYREMTLRFVRSLVAVAPFVRHVSIAGSLATGGFRASDDVDLNLIVDDGRRHLAYVLVNVLGLVHALRHRAKPVDDLTRRPVAPRLMTVNLVLERSQCRPLARQDEDMAFELLLGEPVYGADVLDEVVALNPGLLDHFPQLAHRARRRGFDPGRSVPRILYPGWLDHPARWLGRAAWRYMQWTRRDRPEALARVAYVRETMRPYTLFDEP